LLSPSKQKNVKALKAGKANGAPKESKGKPGDKPSAEVILLAMRVHVAAHNSLRGGQMLQLQAIQRMTLGQLQDKYKLP
jgi:hypothetical protein